MTRKQRAIVLVGCAGIALSGCVAAVIPVVASGAIGHATLRHHRPRADAPPARTPPSAAPAAVPAAPSSVASLPAAPADRSTMTVGQAYRGDLPSPTGAVAGDAQPPAALEAVPADAAGRRSSTWTDVMRFAATAALQRPVGSALLARGSTAAAPHWAPCGDKPLAVLVNLPADGPSPFFDGATDNLKAIETMGLMLVYASDQSAGIAAQRSALKAMGVAPPATGTTLFVGTPGAAAGTRATIAGQYCVVAVVGRRAGDFPNATLPGAGGASPGWFLIR